MTGPTPTDIVRSAHVGFTVSDADRTAAMFVDLFGYRIVSAGGRPQRGFELLTGVPGADVYVVHLHHPDPAIIDIELLRYLAPADARVLDARPCDVGHAHLTFEVQDVRALVEAAAGYGMAPAGRVVVSSNDPATAKQVVYLKGKDPLTIEVISAGA